MTPNALAWVALGSWPVVALAVFALRRASGRLARTTAWMLVLPAMFLPSNLIWNLPGVPDLDKYRVGTLSVVVALELFHSRGIGEILRAHRFARLVLVVLVWGAVQTARANPDALTFGPIVLPGLGSHDALSLGFGVFLDFYLPFAIGHRVFRTERDLRDLFEVLSTAALIYLPLCAVELRLSPQLHTWVYGYFPSEFWQAMRGGGFRPVVFMNHGLTVAMFLFGGFCASLALEKISGSVWPSPRTRAALIGVFILLAKSLGAALYAGVFAIAGMFLSIRSWARVVLVAAIFVVAYPTLRAAGAFPRDDVVEFFAGISSDRADSLLFRFVQEEQLLARARERPVFGWGSWGRNQIYRPWGRISIGDGFWILQLGTFGAVGFVAVFALLVVPMFMFVRNRARMPRQSKILGGALALMAALFTLDLVPNSQFGYFQFLFAGALFGVAGRLGRDSRAPLTAGAGARPARAAGGSGIGERGPAVGGAEGTAR